MPNPAEINQLIGNLETHLGMLGDALFDENGNEVNNGAIQTIAYGHSETFLNELISTDQDIVVDTSAYTAEPLKSFFANIDGEATIGEITQLYRYHHLALSHEITSNYNPELYNDDPAENEELPPSQPEAEKAEPIENGHVGGIL